MECESSGKAVEVEVQVTKSCDLDGVAPLLLIRVNGRNSDIEWQCCERKLPFLHA